MQCCSIGTEKVFVELLQNAKNDIDDTQKEARELFFIVSLNVGYSHH